MQPQNLAVLITWTFRTHKACLPWARCQNGLSNKINISDYERISGSQFWRGSIKTSTTKISPCVHKHMHVILVQNIIKTAKMDWVLITFQALFKVHFKYTLFNLQNGQEHGWGSTLRQNNFTNPRVLIWFACPDYLSLKPRFLSLNANEEMESQRTDYILTPRLNTLIELVLLN